MLTASRRAATGRGKDPRRLCRRGRGKRSFPLEDRRARYAGGRVRLRALVACVVLLTGRPAVAGDPRPAVPATDSTTRETPSEEEPSVAVLEQRAQEAFAAGRYDEVVELAAEAFARTGEIRHLYAQAHAERFAGRCSEALGLYARVMAAEPDGVLGQHAREGIKLCEAEIASAPAPAIDVKPSTVPPKDTPPPPTKRRGPDVLGSVLLAFGVASLAAAATFTVLAVSHARKLEDADDEQEIEDEQRRARAYQGAAIGVSLLGTGLVIGGVVRLVQKSRKHRRQ